MADYTLSVLMTTEADTKGFDKVSDKLKNIGGKLQKTGLIMSAAITAPIVAMGFKAVDAASDLEESMNKVGVVFGETAKPVIAFSDDASTALGMSQQAALEALGTYGNLFTAMEVGTEPAADMSMGLVQLAADLASFNNMDPTEVLDKLRAGVVGEVEPLRTLGINLNQTAIAAKAMEMGIADVSVNVYEVEAAQVKAEKAQRKYTKAVEEYGENSDEAILALGDLSKAEEKHNDLLAGTVEALTPAQKAQAAYAIIMEQSTTAQGDFARTADGLANSTRIVKAQISDVAASFGKLLLPYVTQAVQFFQSLLEKFQAMSPASQKIIVVVAAIAAAIGPVLLIVGTLISAIGSIIPIVAAVAGVVSGPLLLAIGAIIAIVAALALAWKNNWGGIRDVVAEIWEQKLKPAFDQIVTTLRDVIPPILEGFKTIWESVLLPAFQTVADFITTYVLPALADIAVWLLEKIPPAIELATQFFTDVLVPAMVLVWEWIEDNLVPILEEIAEWLGENIPIALQAASDFWTGTLKPALETVWAFIQDKVIPIIQTVVGWLQDNIPTAIDTAADVWENTLKPALEAVWSFISDDLWPVLQDVAEIIGIGMQIAIEIGRIAWEGLQPILETLWGIFNDDILPILKDVAEFISDTLGPVVTDVTDVAISRFTAGLRTLRRVIIKVWNWLKKLLDKLKDIASANLGILSQQSPSEFEQSLLDVAVASSLVVESLQMVIDTVESMGPITSIFDNWKSDFKGVYDLAKKFGGFMGLVMGGKDPEDLQKEIDALGDLDDLIGRSRAEMGVLGWYGQWDEANAIAEDLTFLEEHRLDLQNKLNAAKEDELGTIVDLMRLQEKMQQLDWMKEQMDIIEAVQKAGIEAGALFQGITFGMDATMEDMVAMMDLGLTELIAKASQKLEIGSPSRVFERFGAEITKGLAQGIMGGMDMPALALQRSTPALIGAASAGATTYQITAHYSKYQNEISLRDDLNMIRLMRR